MRLGALGERIQRITVNSVPRSNRAGGPWSTALATDGSGGDAWQGSKEAAGRGHIDKAAGAIADSPDMAGADVSIGSLGKLPETRGKST
jgi:hypothetical protein